MGKSIFPLNPEPEDNSFHDPDARFHSLPYSNEVPEPYPESYRTPPYSFQFFKYQTCREKIATVSFFSFACGWVLSGNYIGKARYGNAVTRWRQLWCNVIGGFSACGVAILGVWIMDLNCSPYAIGRRRNMHFEESIRHSLNAKYGLYENINKIMMSKERITKEEFYQAFHETLQASEKKEY